MSIEILDGNEPDTEEGSALLRKLNEVIVELNKAHRRISMLHAKLEGLNEKHDNHLHRIDLMDARRTAFPIDIEEIDA